MSTIGQLLSGVLLLSASTLAVADPPDLPGEMSRMIRKIDTARTIEVTIQSEIQEIATWTTHAASASENRLSLKLSYSMPTDPKTQRVQFISDGSSLLTSTTDKGRQITSAHPRLKDRFQKSLGRTGFLYTYLTPVDNGAQNSESLSELITLSNCAVEAEESLRDKNLTVATYDFQVQGTSQSVPCRVWIDRQSHLPVKRTFTLQEKQVTETYLDWKINQAIQTETFDITN